MHQDGGIECMANAKLIASAPKLLDAVLAIKEMADKAMDTHVIDFEAIINICNLRRKVLISLILHHETGFFYSVSWCNLRKFIQLIIKIVLL